MGRAFPTYQPLLYTNLHYLSTYSRVRACTASIIEHSNPVKAGSWFVLETCTQSAKVRSRGEMHSDTSAKGIYDRMQTKTESPWSSLHLCIISHAQDMDSRVVLSEDFRSRVTCSWECTQSLREVHGIQDHHQGSNMPLLDIKRSWGLLQFTPVVVVEHLLAYAFVCLVQFSVVLIQDGFCIDILVRLARLSWTGKISDQWHRHTRYDGGDGAYSSWY